MSLLPGQVLRSDHLNNILRALREATSVISGLEVVPTSPASMNIIVKSGVAIIGGSLVSLGSDTQVPVPTADASYPRFDLVTLKSNGAIGYYVGTPEAAVAVDLTKPETYVKPKPPSTPAGELALAEVFVPAGATAIDKIIDRRIVTGLNASQITSGRFPMARMPDGASGKVLIAQGVGVDPAYADPNFNLIQVSGTALTARDWSSDFAKLQNLDILLSAHRDALLSKLDELVLKLRDPGDADIFTTTPLAASGVYTSPSRDFASSRLGYACAMGIADQASLTDGVYAELSLDGTNWDYQGAKATASANVGVALSQEVVARYVRFVWKNGATAQTVFRFGGRYHI